MSDIQDYMLDSQNIPFVQWSIFILMSLGFIGENKSRILKMVYSIYII